MHKIKLGPKHLQTTVTQKAPARPKTGPTRSERWTSWISILIVSTICFEWSDLYPHIWFCSYTIILYHFTILLYLLYDFIIFYIILNIQYIVLYRFMISILIISNFLLLRVQWNIQQNCKDIGNAIHHQLIRLASNDCSPSRQKSGDFLQVTIVLVINCWCTYFC